ncbi:winged helix-turn-helix domain-containing protein [Streptomyces alkaliphilus]|uniref:winged helix-turn-helix domain-containing protein n=1 Tax=Streptomyces alkaliphilus TaxID=1472722 RepID=UPI0012956874|nr:winged helix-turn-helix domain-containing protein [Streptomyces alkaliphilus]
MLEEHPTPARRVRGGQGTLPGPRSGSIKHISKDELARLHPEENLSFPKIAVRLGTDRHTVREPAHQHGIPARHGRRPKATITREWLHEQHIVHGRTLVELAESVGVSPATMNRWAKTHQIPARRFGTHTHHPDLRGNLHSVPEILRPALTGPASWKRLRVLAELPAHPDIAAAKALNLDRATVWSYLDRLEK